MRFLNRKKRGFSLIELILTIAILGIVSVVIGRILLQAYQTFLTSKVIATTDWNGFLTLEKMANDIHSIRSAGDIGTISPSQLSFVDVSGTNVQYQISGTSLLRNSLTVATGVQALSLSYLDKSGATTATPSLVRYIGISVSFVQDGLSTTISTAVGTRGMT